MYVRDPLPVKMMDRINEVFKKQICKTCETLECMSWGASGCRRLTEEKNQSSYMNYLLEKYGRNK